MRCIRLPVTGDPELIDVDGTDFRALAAAIGGGCQYVETFPLPDAPDQALLVCDEEGRYHGWGLNPRASALLGWAHLVGVVLVVGRDADDLVDLAIAEPILAGLRAAEVPS